MYAFPVHVFRFIRLLTTNLHEGLKYLDAVYLLLDISLFPVFAEL